MTSDDLATRLALGWDKCNRAPPDQRTRMDDFWIDLLHQYEAAVDKERTWPQSVSPDASPPTPNTDTPPTEQATLL